jgi:hypothetical protein
VVNARRVEQPLKKGVNGLTWKSNQLTARVNRAAPEPEATVVLDGHFNKPSWSLLHKNILVPLSAQGDFKLTLTLKKRLENFELVVVNPKGEVQREPILIEIAAAQWERAFPKKLPPPKVPELPPKYHFFTPGLNFTVLSYRETRVQSVSQTALTGKFAYRFALGKSGWDLGASGYLTLLPITKNTDSTARFLGLNLRVGYSLPWPREPWQIGLMAGWYYTTMIVSPPTFGFLSMAGPQLFPVVRYRFGSGKAIATYFKWSPVSDSTSLMSLGNYELAAGGAYVIPLMNRRSVSVTLDAASLKLVVGRVTIESLSVSLGGAYGF